MSVCIYIYVYVTASEMIVHHVLIILTLTVFQGHTVLNHENKTRSNILETVQAMPIRFVLKIVRLQVYILCSQSDDRALYSRSQVRINLDPCLLCTIRAISRAVCKLLHSHLG